MVDNTFHRIAELLRGVIELLWYRPAGLPGKEIMALLPKVTPLTDFEVGYSSSNNTPRYETIVRLASIPLVKAGWMVKNNKGRWYLTADGREACKRFTNSKDLYTEALRRLEEEQQNIPEIMITAESSEEAAWDQIEKYLQGRKLFELRVMLAHLLRASGYHVAWTAYTENDANPVDLVAWMDPIGAKKSRILIQVIHKGQAMTAEGIKSFTSMLRPNDYGLIFSTGAQTNEAIKEIKLVSPNMSFMGLDAFFDLWVRHYSKLDPDAQRLLPLKPIHFLYF